MGEIKVRRIGIALLVALLTVLVYLPVLGNGFVNWDDPEYVYENEHIRSLGKESLRWMFTTYHASNWHPLTWLSHGIDYAMWGLNPLGHHLTSIVLHGLNTFLVVILITRLVSFGRNDITAQIRNTKYEIRNSLLAGAVTGLLFGLHPLHVESVAWVSERKDVLYAFFYLLSILAYVRYVRAEAGKRTVPYVVCLVLFLLSLLSKPMAVTLPVVLLILDVYPLGRTGIKGLFTSHWRVVVEKVPFFTMTIVSSIMTVQAQEAGGALKSLDFHSMGERVPVGIRALLFYLYKVVWPVDLAPLYPYPSGASLFNIQYLGFVVMVVGITVFCIWQWRLQRVWAALWAYYVVTLFPVLGIVQVGEQAAADRYTYLSSLVPFVLVGLLMISATERAIKGKGIVVKRVVLFLCLTGILLSLVFSTLQQGRIWKDPFTLWNAEIEIYPDYYRGYKKRGQAYSDRGNHELAIQDYNRSIQIYPIYAATYLDRGVSYAGLDKYEQAIEDFTVAIMMYPEYTEALTNRGIAHLMLGNFQQALRDFNRTLVLNPEDGDAFFQRNLAYKKAIKDYTKFIQKEPENEEHFINRGGSYAMIGQFQEALKDFTRAISLRPGMSIAYYNRGLVYQKMGEEGRALEDYQEAARLGEGKAQEYLRSRGEQW
jgi:tetratricopeptide (TPR) repeat protein